jgi:hypothetical protein
VTYLPYPPDLHLGLRCADGLSRVTTPYCALCGDDDFVVPSGLRECARFLDGSAGYVAVTGRTLALTYGLKGLLRRGTVFDDVLGGDFNLSHTSLLQRFIRLNALASVGCPPLYYGLMRTQVARAAFALTKPGMKYSSLELLLNSMALLEGAAKSLPYFFSVRDYASEPHREAIRDEPGTYFARPDLEYIKPLLAERLKQKESVDDATAAYVADVLLFDHFPADRAVPRSAPTLVQRMWRRALGLAQKLASLFAPGLLAAGLAIPEDDLRALLKAQRDYLRYSAG